MSLSWQKRRSEFSHDWLKNQYMPALAKWLNILDDRIEDPDFECSFVTSVLPKWESHRKEVFTLIQDFEREMSPRQLLECTILSRCDKSTKNWLGDLVHNLWLKNNSVRQCVDCAYAQAQATEAAYAKLQGALQHCRDVKSAPALKPLRGYFLAFRESCQDLARAIGKLTAERKF